MKDLALRIEAVRRKVEGTLVERERDQRRLQELEAARRNDRQEHAVLKARIAELERENEVLRMARTLEGGQGSLEAKEQIEELVNEIDRCLELLNAPGRAN